MYLLEQIKLNVTLLVCKNFNEVGGGNEIPNSQIGKQSELTPEDTLDRLSRINDWFSSTMDLEADRRDELLGSLDGTDDLLEGLEGTDEDIAELAFHALGEGENPNLGPNLTPQEVGQSIEAIQSEMSRLQSQIDAGGEGSQESVRRLALYNNFLQVIDTIESESMAQSNEGVSWVGGDVIANGQQFVNMNEGDGIHEDEALASDLFGYGHNTGDTAWCGGFVTRICHESGYNVQTSHPLRAKSFIECVDPELEKTHTCFKTPDGRALGGNQGDRATIQDISRPVMGWVMPQDVGNPERTFTRDRDGSEAVAVENIPAGAILVFPRGGGSNWS